MPDHPHQLTRAEIDAMAQRIAAQHRADNGAAPAQPAAPDNRPTGADTPESPAARMARRKAEKRATDLARIEEAKAHAAAQAAARAGAQAALETMNGKRPAPQPTHGYNPPVDYHKG